MKLVRGILTVAIAAAAMMIGTTAAQAAVADYHPDQQARTFKTGAGGWSGSTEYTSTICIAGVTCPAVSQSRPNTGGAEGDGYLRASVLRG